MNHDIKKDNIHWIIGIILLLAIGFFIGIYSQESEINVYNDETGVNTLSVKSTITKEVAPDEAEIFLAVETLKDSAEESQTQNANLSNSLMNALNNIGISDSQTETTNYSVKKEKEWDKENKEYDVIGYKTVNKIKITLSELKKVGEAIDVAVKAGVNKVDGINFTLSTEKQKEVKENALYEAGQYARTKANKIASGLGTSVKGVHSISENSYSYIPNYYGVDSLARTESNTPINPQTVSVNTTLNVEFEV